MFSSLSPVSLSTPRDLGFVLVLGHHNNSIVAEQDKDKDRTGQGQGQDRTGQDKDNPGQGQDKDRTGQDKDKENKTRS